MLGPREPKDRPPLVKVQKQLPRPCSPSAGRRDERCGGQTGGSSVLPSAPPVLTEKFKKRNKKSPKSVSTGSTQGRKEIQKRSGFALPKRAESLAAARTQYKTKVDLRWTHARPYSAPHEYESRTQGSTSPAAGIPRGRQLKAEVLDTIEEGFSLYFLSLDTRTSGRWSICVIATSIPLCLCPGLNCERLPESSTIQLVHS